MQLEKLLPTLLQALIASMHIVRSRQGTCAESGDGKSDGTIVTITDTESQDAGFAVLRKAGVNVTGEEEGVIDVPDSDLVVLYDPVDGTFPFRVGSITSTIISGVYDKTTNRMVMSVTCEPATGRFWWSIDGHGTFTATVYAPSSADEIIAKRRGCRVWAGELSPKAMVFVDFYAGFKKAGFTNLPETTWTSLFAILFPENASVNMYGSNGAHHALIANGSDGAAGAITSAFSGPWDLCPIHSVIEAGGCAKGFRVDMATGKPTLLECRALDPYSFQFAISANNPSTLAKLTGFLRTAMMMATA